MCFWCTVNIPDRLCCGSRPNSAGQQPREGGQHGGLKLRKKGALWGEVWLLKGAFFEQPKNMFRKNGVSYHSTLLMASAWSGKASAWSDRSRLNRIENNCCGWRSHTTWSLEEWNQWDPWKCTNIVSIRYTSFILTALSLPHVHLRIHPSPKWKPSTVSSTCKAMDFAESLAWHCTSGWPGKQTIQNHRMQLLTA